MNMRVQSECGVVSDGVSDGTHFSSCLLPGICVGTKHTINIQIHQVLLLVVSTFVFQLRMVTIPFHEVQLEANN